MQLIIETVCCINGVVELMMLILSQVSPDNEPKDPNSNGVIMNCPSLSTYFERETIAEWAEKKLTENNDVGVALQTLAGIYAAFYRFSEILQKFQAKQFSSDQQIFDAIQTWEEMASLFAENNLLIQESCCQTQMALAYKQLDKFDEAIQYGTLAIDRAERAGEHCLLATTHNNLANVYRKAGKLEPALKHRQSALEILRSLDDTHEIAVTLLGIGNLQADAGLVDKALDTYYEALQLFRSLNAFQEEVLLLKNVQILRRKKDFSGWDESRSVKKLQDARRAGQVQNWSIAKTMAKVALDYYRNHKDVDGEAQVLSVMSLVDAGLGNYESALKLIDEAITLCRGRSDLVSLFTFLWNRQSILLSLGRPSFRIQTLEEMLSIAFKIGVMSNIVPTLKRLAETHKDVGNYLIGAQNAKELAGISHVVGSDHDEAVALCLQAGCEMGLNELGQAYANCIRALKIFGASFDEQDKVMASVILGQVYLHIGCWERARQILSEAMTTLRDNNDIANLIVCYECIGIACQNSDELHQAGQYFQEALNLCKGYRNELLTTRIECRLRIFNQSFSRIQNVLPPSSENIRWPAICGQDFITLANIATVNVPGSEMNNFSELFAALEKQPLSYPIIVALLYRGQKQLMSGQLEAAIIDISEALAKLETIYQNLKEPEHMLAFWDQPLVRTTYNTLVSVLYQAGNHEVLLFELTERIRLRSLRKSLGRNFRIYAPHPFIAGKILPDSNIMKIMFHYGTLEALSRPGLSLKEREMLGSWLPEGDAEVEEALNNLADTKQEYVNLKRGESLAFSELSQLLIL